MPFEAVLFDPVSKASSRVSVRVFGSSLEVVDPEKGPALRVDPAKSELRAGGWDVGSIQITWPGEGGLFAISSKDSQARAELSRIPAFQVALDVAFRAQTHAKRRGRLGMTLVAVTTLLPVLLLLAIFVFRGQIVDFVLQRIPFSVDQEVGKMFEGEVVASKDTLPHNEATRAITLIVDRLATASADKRLAFKVCVQRSKDVNAFAAPGGLIVVYTGLIDEAESAEEAAGVLAHEMAHVTRRHSMRQLIYAGGILPLMGLLVGQPDAAALVQNLGQLSSLKFSRSQEEEADRVGFDTLVQARISPDGMARFFERLAETEGPAPPFLSTHPSSAGRAAAIRERARALAGAPVEALPIDWNAVKNAIH